MIGRAFFLKKRVQDDKVFSCPRGLLLFQLNMTCTWRAKLNVIHALFFVWVMNFQPLDFIWINKSHETIYGLWKNEIRQYVIFCHLRLVKTRKIKTNWFVNFLKFFYFYVKGAKNRPLRWEEQRGTNFYGRHSATDVSKMLTTFWWCRAIHAAFDWLLALRRNRENRVSILTCNKREVLRL